MRSGSWGSQEWIAFSSAAALVVYVITAVLALIAVRQTKKLREEQSRPYVIVDFDFDHDPTVVYIAIKNIGSTPATEVRLAFDKPLVTTGWFADKDINDVSVWRDPIPMLAPGRVIRVSFGVSFELLNPKADIPLSYKVSATYGDLRGKRYADPAYTMDMAHASDASARPDGLPQLVGELRSVGKELAKWSEPTRGLRVFTTDRAKFMARTHRPRRRKIAANVRQEEGLMAYMRWHIDRQMRKYGWR